MSIYIFLSLCIVFGYLLGSVPFGLVITKAAGLGDIRKIGSGNIGATNVLRTGHKGLALLTLLCDGGKAAIAALLAMWLAPEAFASIAGLTAGTAAVIGHNFPLWLNFKGGKGIAASFGMVFVTAPMVGVLAGLTWLLVAFTTRYSSLSALVAFTLTPLYAVIFATPEAVCFFAFLGLLSLVMHKENLGHLARGEESKIGQKSKGKGKEDKK